MLGERKIVAFSPELGIANPESENFYPRVELIIDDVLPQNLISALYGIQRTGYYLRFFTLKNNYLDCSVILDNQHKFLEKNEEEKKELSICSNNANIYQFSNTIALKNTGFSDFRGKTNIKMLINIQNLIYISVKTDTGSNYNTNNKLNEKLKTKNVILERNITDDYIKYNLTNKINEKSFYLNINNSNYLLIEIPAENIDSQNFFLIDIKLYFEKNYIYYLKNDALLVNTIENSNKNDKSINDEDYNKFIHKETQTFNEINFSEKFLISAFLENEFFSITDNKFNKTSNDLNVSNKIVEFIKKNRIYFANDNYKINLNQFELFEMKYKPFNKNFTLVDGIIDFLFYFVLVFLAILLTLYIFLKIKTFLANKKLKKNMQQIPSTARTVNSEGKKYYELGPLDNSIPIRQTIQKSDF